MGFLERLRAHKASKNNAPLMVDIKKVGDSRAIFMGTHDMPMVHFSLLTMDDDSLTLELTPAQTAQCIEALTHSYYAINPELKIRRAF